jgi:hypothetical protein
MTTYQAISDESEYHLILDRARLSCCLGARDVFARPGRSLTPMWGNSGNEAPGPVAEADKPALFS